MKKLLLLAMASLAGTVVHGALAELNVADGSIQTPDGTFVGRDFTVPRDFKLELLHVTVPAREGQWVPLNWDNKGRLLVASYNSDRLNRLTIPPVGTSGPVQVEPIDGTKVGASEGIVYAWGGAYINVNRSTTMRHGIYRLDDTNGDDKYDQTTVVRNSGTGGGDHGTHDLHLMPGGDRISLLAGNATPLVYYQTSRVPPFFGEDNLVIRNQINGQSINQRAPEAFVTTFDRAGSFDLFAIGMRNPVSHTYNKDGELFIYDADLEFDMALPWYKATDVLHVISGADAGFRDGSRKHPAYYFDYHGKIANIGCGSPVGSVFGTGTKFPARYQDAMFIADWSYGYVWAVFVSPNGSTYKAEPMPFISGRPFAASGIIVNPVDGSLLIMTTGTQLYRVTYTGTEPTERTRPDTEFAAARTARHNLEAFHGKQDAAALPALWPQLNSPDRAMRFAARTALEWQPVATWREQALRESDPRKLIATMGSLARVSGKYIYNTRPNDPAPDKALQARMLAALDRIDWNTIAYQDKLDLLRTYELTFIRLGMPDEATRQRLIAKFDPLLPANQRELNWELSEILIYLQAPSAANKVMALLRNAPSGFPFFADPEWVNPELRVRSSGSANMTAAQNVGISRQDVAKQNDQIQYAQLLRTLTSGWTPALREEYMQWFITAQQYRGQNHFAQSLNIIRADAVSQIPAAERAPLQAIIDTPVTYGGRRGGGGAVAPAAQAPPATGAAIPAVGATPVADPAGAAPAAAAGRGGRGGRGGAGRAGGAAAPAAPAPATPATPANP